MNVPAAGCVALLSPTERKKRRKKEEEEEEAWTLKAFSQPVRTHTLRENIPPTKCSAVLMCTCGKSCCSQKKKKKC